MDIYVLQMHICPNCTLQKLLKVKLIINRILKMI